jgi:hypothetical protein
MVTESERAGLVAKAGFGDMSDQKAQNLKKPAKQGQDPKPDAKTNASPPAEASPAAETLASAVKSAQQAAQSTDRSPARAESARPEPSWRRTGAWAAGLAAAVGVGWFGGASVISAGRPSQTILAQWAEASANIRQNQEDMVRLTGDVRALRAAIDGLKDGVDRVRGETVSKQSQLLDRLDRLDRTAQDSAGKAARLAEQLERLASADRDPAKLAPLMDRLERMEKQASAASPATPKPAAPATGEPSQTGSIDTKPQADLKPPINKSAPLEGWVLRDIYDGVALIEGPNHRFHEVAPGQSVAAVGRIEAIERRGKAWVVVTSKGVIGAERWQ